MERVSAHRVWGTLLVLWMTVIFFFSSLPGSGSVEPPPLLYFLERKGAHLVEFFVLAVLAHQFFRTWYREASPRSLSVLAFCFASVYGLLDEMHQAFVFGRGPRFSDAFIDMLGAVLALGVLFFFGKYRKK